MSSPATAFADRRFDIQETGRKTMAVTRKWRKGSRIWPILAVGLALPTGIGTLFAAEEASQDQIIRALKPRVTRGLSAQPPRPAEDAGFVETLRNRTTRSLSSEEREKIATIATQRPSIDLEINFDFNSANVSSKSMPQVTALARALSSAELKGSTFLLAGHTDAKGSDSFNQELSERRAEAVKRMLSERYRLDASSLVTVGYGETRLKNASNPLAGENRRVQVVNMGDK
jgi:outer membrane protein OmpA-like peptidoglycan-associated protein